MKHAFGDDPAIFWLRHYEWLQRRIREAEALLVSLQNEQAIAVEHLKEIQEQKVEEATAGSQVRYRISATCGHAFQFYPNQIQTCLGPDGVFGHCAECGAEIKYAVETGP